MPFQCPYCHHELGEQARARCPVCKRVMRIPVKRSREAVRIKRRILERIDREAEARRAEMAMPPSLALLRSPRVLLPTILLLAGLGAFLIVAADKTQRRSVTQSKHGLALRELNVLATALGRYRYHVGHYPTNALALRALREFDNEPDWNGPYVNNLRPDPWEHPYVYQLSDDGQARVFSVGPDGILGTPDDLHPDPAAFNVGTNWTQGWVPAADRLPGVRIGRPAKN